MEMVLPSSRLAVMVYSCTRGEGGERERDSVSASTCVNAESFLREVCSVE